MQRQPPGTKPGGCLRIGIIKMSDAFPQYPGQFLSGQLFTAAGSAYGRACYCLQVCIVYSHLCKRRRKSYFFYKCCQSFYTFQGSFFVRFVSSFNAPHVYSKSCKLRGSLLNMTVQNRMQHCKSLTVVAVGVCSELMIQHMTLEIRYLSQLQYTVFPHSRRPHLPYFASSDVREAFAKPPIGFSVTLPRSKQK